jgi:iron complex outermembrane receptor protein
MFYRTMSSVRRVNTFSKSIFTLTLLGSVSIGGAAFAQDAPTVSDTTAPKESGDIVVTARRKSENILKTPISIKALTAEDIAARGINTIQDIAQATPGLNVQQAATTGGRSDRSFSSIQLRGFVPSTSAAQTTSIFIDGAPVSVATALQSLTDPERVEIIKGPQSALFGRQTFAGAINVVTKAPNLDHLTGTVSLSGGTRGNYDGSIEVSTPIIKDVLAVTASFRAFGKDGSYKNAFVPGQTLGDQSTKTGSLAILFKPTDHLTFKAFGMYTKLDDGPSANGLIAAVGTPAGQNLVIGQSNCRITNSAGVSNPFFCGIAPNLSAVAPSANTATTPAIAAFLARTTGRVLAPDQGVHGYGLVNTFYHIHFNADWALGESGVTVSSLTAFNSELKSELADLDNYYSVSVPSTGVEGFYNFPYMIEGRSRDFSQEIRASFENGGPLHASAGGSYLVQRNQSDAGSPFTFGPTAGVATFAGALQSRTYGLFGSLGYDFSSHFTLSGDARYQIDKLYAFAGQGGINQTSTDPTVVKVAENGLIVSKVYKTFLPRVIAQYNIDKTKMIYASYSKGINPGNFNTLFITSPEPALRAAAAANGFQVAVDPEKLTNYEIGAKGRAFNRIRYDAAAYLAIWTNQIQNQSITIPADGKGPSAVGAPLQLSASVNTGSVRVWGLEGNLGVDLAPGLTLDAGAAYVKTYILTATNIPLAAFYNIPAGGFRGKENPFVSKYSASVSLAYTKPISPTFDGFGRMDFSYKSGGYADIANVVRAPDMNQFNFHVGVRNKTYSLEAFVTNAFNNRAYYNVGTGSEIVSGVSAPAIGTYSALIASLRDLRTFGMKAAFKF